jgi:hypothetical protein
MFETENHYPKCFSTCLHHWILGGLEVRIDAAYEQELVPSRKT